MATEYQQALLQAALNEMRRALDDPEADPATHALDLAAFIGENAAGTVQADMTFGDVPPWLATRPGGLSIREDGKPEFSMGLQVNPSAILLRIQNQATGSVWFRDQLSGDVRQIPLDPGQQQTIDEYARAAAFDLTGVANGRLVEPEPHEIAVSADPQELLDAISEHIEALEEFTQELHDRAEYRTNQDHDGEEDPSLMAARALTLAVHSACNQLTALQTLSRKDLNQERWQPAQV